STKLFMCGCGCWSTSNSLAQAWSSGSNRSNERVTKNRTSAQARCLDRPSRSSSYKCLTMACAVCWSVTWPAPSFRSAAPQAVRSRSGNVLTSYIDGPPCTFLGLLPPGFSCAPGREQEEARVWHARAAVLGQQNREGETAAVGTRRPCPGLVIPPISPKPAPPKICTVMLPLSAHVSQGKRLSPGVARARLAIRDALPAS